MNSEESKRLVIDASVAQAAGDKEGISVNCKKFMLAVRESNHRVAMTPEIYQEWQRTNDEKGRKPSSFTSTWFTTMMARRKVEVHADVPNYEEVWVKIEQAIDINQGIKQAQKDFLLIKAALLTDKTIVSVDEKARRPFKIAAVQVDELKDIVWVNPDKIEEEKPIEWLRNGANPDRERLLGN